MQLTKAYVDKTSCNQLLIDSATSLLTIYLPTYTPFLLPIPSEQEFLSELGIVHRDLACRNVLVGENKVLKISDFGLAREDHVYIKTTDGKLPLRWSHTCLCVKMRTYVHVRVVCVYMCV